MDSIGERRSWLKGRRYHAFFGMVLVLGLVLAACGSTDEDAAEPTVTRIPDAANAPVLTPANGGSPAAAGDDGPSPVAVGGDKGSATPGVAGSPVAAGSPAAGSPVAGAFEVVSFDIYFEPDSLTLPADTAVVVSLSNEGASEHNFSIDELEIDVDQAPSEEQEVEINAPAGTYEFYCDVPGHRESGMVGTLVVE